MTQPENRWQLLLVADDGRIIPFKHIKGIALTLLISLILLGLLCAGLAWRLTAETSRNRQSLDRLAEAKKEAAFYKHEHELVTAELVLADARMKKAGLPIPERRVPKIEKAAESMNETEPAADTPAENRPTGARRTEPGSDTKASAAAASPPPIPVAEKAKAPTPRVDTTKTTPPPKSSVVSVDDLEIKHDAARGIVTARFRVHNTGPRSSPVAGRCAVVLKSEHMDPDKWMTLPHSNLVNGRPDAEQGRPFKISRFIDMAIEAVSGADPSAFTTATVFIFDLEGAVLLKKEYPIDLPAPPPKPKPKPEPEPKPAPTAQSLPEPAEDGAAATQVAGPASVETSSPATPAKSEDSRAPY